MPKNQNIKSVLILGSGPIVVGQACEFDYSGVQACKALRESGCRVILVNSNPATIMTDPDMADVTYIEPIRWQTLKIIIEREKPDALLPTMGGQTALNCALDLERHGVLKDNQVKMIGANAQSINKAEDRALFDQAMKKIGLKTADSGIASTLEEAYQVLDEVKLPCIIRPSFTMGGTGGGIAYNLEEFRTICMRGLELSPTSQLLIDRSLIGWKEYELEVVRDAADNCIIVCVIENLDPMGVHTGDSITVAPAQTLTDKEYQNMRNAAIQVLCEIGIETGGSNVQFAVNPEDGDLIVIEMNPRVSRSSALASKATGFPIAKVAAKLAIGYTLDELKNEITGGVMPASFEPTIDYVVTKIPRFSFEKFPDSDHQLTTQMKSVGEVMAIGRNFQESIQKALRGLELDLSGFDPILTDLDESSTDHTLKKELSFPGSQRILYVADAFRLGFSLEEVQALTRIDPWFLAEIKDLIETEHWISQNSPSQLTSHAWLQLKRKGFSDLRLSVLWNKTETSVRELRIQNNIKAVYKRVDTCSAEFDSKTDYLYSTYEEESDVTPLPSKSIMVLGSGPNRIGQGIEFDYCCVHAALTVREMGLKSIIVNCNPETVSTDFDVANRLYFESISYEDILNIVEFEKPVGVIIQYGGQTPLKLAQQLQMAGVPIIGTSSDAIDRAENRKRFQDMVYKLQLLQPKNRTATSKQAALEAADQIQYPLIARPSYVLGGRAMEIIKSEGELDHYLTETVIVSEDSPVLLDQYLTRAIEVDVDAICDGKQVKVMAIMQHIEQAGIHSGDSACSFPPFDLTDAIQEKITEIIHKLALELGVIGLMNVQFAIKNSEVYIIEVNPRASRTIPFISKALGIPVAKLGTQIMLGVTLADLNLPAVLKPIAYAVKGAVFSFEKFCRVDPILGPEMKSTGEVMGLGDSFEEAYLKTQLAVKMNVPHSGKVLMSVCDSDKRESIELVRLLIQLDFKIIATAGTAQALQTAGFSVERVNKVMEGRPNLVDLIVNKEVQLVINTTEDRQAIKDSYTIRRSALTNRVLYTTTISGAKAITQAIQFGPEKLVRSLQELKKHHSIEDSVNI